MCTRYLTGCHCRAHVYTHTDSTDSSLQLLQWFRVSSESVILFFAQLMGVYFISSLLLLFSKIPTEYRQELQNTVNMEHFVVFFKHWFDVLFLLCSVVSLVGLVLLERWNHAQRLDYYH